MTGLDELQLFTPEEISEKTRGQLKPHTLRRLAREGKVGCVRGERDRILFTVQQIRDLLASWTQEPVVPGPVEPVGLAFEGTARSRRRRLAG